MAKQVQIRRDTFSNLGATVPAQGELGVDTTNKRIIAGDGATSGGIPHPNYADIQKNYFSRGTVGGTGDAITLALPIAPASYTAGLGMRFKAGAGNTGPVTVNVNSLGTKNIYKITNGTIGDLEADDIVSGGEYEIIYDGAQFQIAGSGLGGGGGGAGWELLSLASAAAAANYVFPFDSSYKNFELWISNVAISPAADPSLEFSSNNQSSWIGGTNYNTGYYGINQAGTAILEDNIAQALVLLGSGTGGTTIASYLVQLFDPTEGTEQYKRFTWSGSLRSSSGGQTMAAVNGGGHVVSTTGLTDVRFDVGGTITRGYAELWGLKA